MPLLFFGKGIIKETYDAIHTQLASIQATPLWNTHLPSEIAPEPSLLVSHMTAFMSDT